MGNHVTDALAGAKFNGVSGVPVNAWESGDIFEGSHLQTAGMMSHRQYSNYTSFMEAELAVMQDLGYAIDRKAYFGYSVYGNNQTLNNTHGFSARNAAGTAYTSAYSEVPLGIGLHVYGAGNTITQSANILTKGTGAAGIRVDGEKNTINVPQSTEIHADGKNGKGVLFAYGRNQNLNLAGKVTASGSGGNAVEFNFGSSTNGAEDEYRGSYIRYERKVDSKTGNITKGTNLALNAMDNNTYNASANELMGEMITHFNLSGKITGGENAIYIGRNAFVKNINVENGAEIKGNIKSEWKHFFEKNGFWDKEVPTSYEVLNEDSGETTTVDGKIEPLYIQYNGQKYVYNQYIPDLVTNLNFNGDIKYSGDITGKENMKINVTGGKLTYGGTADVVNVKVEEDAYLYGGTFSVNDMTSKLATGLTDKETGKFINHGTIGAASADTNQVINGKLESDGILEAYAGGKKGQIVVNGTADVNGSIVSATNALPGDTVKVLTAKTVNGTLKNPTNGKPYEASGMLSTTGEVINNDTITVTAQAANNLGEMTAQQAEAYEAMNAMQQSLKGDKRRDEMRSLYSLNANDAKHALTQISASAGLQMVSMVQQSTLASRVISDRLHTAFSMRPVEITVPVNHLADSGKPDAGIKMNMELPMARDNNAWVKFTKNWGELKGGASYHGSAISGGYDRRMNDNWRGGVFLSYQTMGLGTESSSANIYDTRFGVYAGYHKNAADAFIYADYGWVRNKLHRGIGMLGLGAEAKYNANLIEIGGEYKYDLHASDGKIWHVSPYAGLQFSWMNQNAYKENGAGIFNQHVAGMNNTYVAGQIGLELKRYLQRGNYGLRLGVKHAFAGADPELSFRYEGYDGKSYTLRNSQDKTHFLFSLWGETEFAKGWFLSGEAQLQKGAHDKDISASVQFKRVW
ncbi:autotransporter outer membrane beta-barrel domain-containing protein [Selenomonas ruminantium]|uniref:Autotransporter beta-domain-containing protein n=1 Tax=Selenomonas ruminantium TaxID=971 RepID=A0A1K1QS00_SELRU|nr:autotransporter outer membrane beta-barrel domain-containing protein [Selenomonas ruminantium]SFW62473.1 Autotransporter beta-domain-containing protein [Selenomonas ruminantium]